MRLAVRLFLCLVWLLVLAAPGAAHDEPDRPLRDFAIALGLRDVDTFVETVKSLRRDGRLPARYMTKAEAARAGWRPGDDLCRVAPGRVIGGDRFGNRERKLPVANGRVWYEADLDFACGRRGARRLVWSNDRLIFVTVDHYRTFHEVPE